jgi:hypothetical protein
MPLWPGTVTVTPGPVGPVTGPGPSDSAQAAFGDCRAAATASQGLLLCCEAAVALAGRLAAEARKF